MPGPQVGKADKEHTILPPVDDKADKAASRVGSNAGSACLIFENRTGICVNRDVIGDLLSQLHDIELICWRYLDSYGSTKRPSLLMGTKGSSMSGMTSICA